MDPRGFKPSLGLLDATMVVAGSMIGSGIFIVSADIARHVGSGGWFMAVWVLAGFMTTMAALSYGELSGMFPKAGGQYVYLREAYNPLVGFLFGWSFFAVIQTATIAAVAVAFAKFTAYLFPAFSEDAVAFRRGAFTVSPAQLLSLAVILLLTLINTTGVRNARFIQTVFTLAKLLSLIGLIVAGVVSVRQGLWRHNWQQPWDIHQLSASGVVTALGPAAALGAIAAAMVGSIFSSDSWNNITFIAAEIKNPRRNIGLSLLSGTVLVTLIYCACNLVYLGVLPMQDIAGAAKDRVAIAAADAIAGHTGTLVIAVMIMISTFGCDNGIILAGARVYYTMARDGLFFRRAGTLNGKGVPAFSLWIQAVAACAWSLSGRYGDLLDMISFIVVCFYMLTIAGIFILRRRRPDLPRPYRVPAYPLVPLLYLLMGASFCLLLIIYKPRFTWPGLLITLAGIPIYYLSIRRGAGREKE